MTIPKQHLPGQVVMLTRRTLHRKFLLRPDKAMVQLFGYLYGLYVTRYEQASHACMCESTHYHSGQTDQSGERSEFMRDLHATLARARNLQLNSRDSFWSGSSPGDCVLLDRDAVIDKLLYIWLNPVKDGLVRRVEEWPGFKILPKHWGKKLRFKRPDGFFRDDSLPKYVEFTPMPPPGFEDVALEEARAYFEERIAQMEREIAEQRRKRGLRRVYGAKRARKVSPFNTPKSRAPMRKLNPRFASKDAKNLQMAKTLYYAFVDEHRRRRQELKNGNRDVLFPPGTIFLRKYAGVRCRPPDPDTPGLFPVG